MRLIIKPSDWECTLEMCPPGCFVIDGQLCFKTEYHHDGGEPMAYNSAGEAYHGKSDQVQPVEAVWEHD